MDGFTRIIRCINIRLDGAMERIRAHQRTLPTPEARKFSANGSTCKLTLQAMVRRAGDSDACYPCLEAIEEFACVCEDAVRAAQRSLEFLGLMRKRNRNHDTDNKHFERTNVYVLNWDEILKLPLWRYAQEEQSNVHTNSTAEGEAAATIARSQADDDDCRPAGDITPDNPGSPPKRRRNASRGHPGKSGESYPDNPGSATRIIREGLSNSGEKQSSSSATGASSPNRERQPNAHDGAAAAEIHGDEAEEVRGRMKTLAAAGVGDPVRGELAARAELTAAVIADVVSKGRGKPVHKLVLDLRARADQEQALRAEREQAERKRAERQQREARKAETEHEAEEAVRRKVDAVLAGVSEEELEGHRAALVAEAKFPFFKRWLKGADLMSDHEVRAMLAQRVARTKHAASYAPHGPGLVDAAHEPGPSWAAQGPGGRAGPSGGG